MDRITRERRSWNMSQIRSRDTKPELVVRSVLHRLGFRFRLESAKLPCRPDVVLPCHRTVVFVHGCFWHRHAGCRFAYTPKSSVQFWTRKFQTNIERDEQIARRLRRLGWKIIVVWECQTTDRTALTRSLQSKLAPLLQTSR